MGDVVEVQHRSGAENVHFGFLLLLPMRQVPAFSSFPFTWLSKTSIYMGQKVTFYSLDIIFNIPIELKKKKTSKKEKLVTTKTFAWSGRRRHVQSDSINVY